MIHGEYVDVPSKLQKRHGMVQARAALLLDARRELVLVLEAKVQTSGVYQEAPRDGILDVSLRLLYDPEAPGIPAHRLFRALIACRPRAVRRRVGGRGNEWFDEELSERRVSYESAVPELPAVAVSREPDASINSDLAGNDAVCSTCPSRPSP